MKTNYEKFLKLADTQNIDEKAIIKCLNCTKVVARVLYRELLRERAISKGKVISQSKLKKIALTRLVYDRYFSITVYLQSIIQNVLVDDENFIRLIHEHVDPNFCTEMSAEARMDYLDYILNQTDKDNYLVCQYAAQAILQMLQTSKDLLLSGNTNPESQNDASAVVITLDIPKKS